MRRMSRHRAQPRARIAFLPAAAAIASIVAVVALIALAIALRRAPSPGALARFSVPPPTGTTVFPDSTAVAISPDGHVVALVTAMCRGVATTLHWTLDSRSGFARYAVSGGHGGRDVSVLVAGQPAARVFCESPTEEDHDRGLPHDEIFDAPDGRGGAWGPSDVIVFSPLQLRPADARQRGRRETRAGDRARRERTRSSLSGVSSRTAIILSTRRSLRTTANSTSCSDR